MRRENRDARPAVTGDSSPRILHVVIAAFAASFVGSALGAALVTKPAWFGLDEREPSQRSTAAEDERAAIEARRKAEEERRRQEDEKRRAEGTPSTPPQTGISCDFALPDLKGAFASEGDCYFLQRIFTYALTTQRDGSAPGTWSNTRSGASGTITILETQQRQGVMCRRFQQTVTAAGNTRTATGWACMRDNSWKIEA